MVKECHTDRDYIEAVSTHYMLPMPIHPCITRSPSRRSFTSMSICNDDSKDLDERWGLSLDTGDAALKGSRGSPGVLRRALSDCNMHRQIPEQTTRVGPSLLVHIESANSNDEVNVGTTW
jgi:hypothetical protein